MDEILHMEKKKVLFTGGGGAGKEAIWRLLEKKYDLYFVDSNIKHMNPYIPVSRKFQVPLAKSPGFKDCLLELCAKLKIDVLIPSVDEELIFLAQSINDQIITKIMLPQESYVTTMLDKLLMIKALEGHAILVPKTESLDTEVSEFRYPCIIKPRLGRGSRGVVSVSSRAEVENFKIKLGQSAVTHVIQQKYFGTEYTVQMVADAEGKLICVVPIRIFSKKGVTIHAQVDNNKLVIEACKFIHKKIPCRATYNIQLMLTEAGEVYPFEINPRISTTFCLVVSAGLDPIDLFLNSSTSASLKTAQNNKTLFRHWYNEFT